MSPNRTFSRQSGISMVEALVALVVLSIGMLGIASLYVSSLQAGRTALLRTQAVNLVNDMMDRIRSNTAGRKGYDLSEIDEPAEQDCVASEKDTNCTPAQLAEDDLAKWILSIDDLLPGANEDVDVTLGGGAAKYSPDTYVVSVSWQEPGDTDMLTYSTTLSIIPVEP
jgi:type IV pilus assembly protein PilV